MLGSGPENIKALPCLDDNRIGHWGKIFPSVNGRFKDALPQAESSCAIQQQDTIQHLFVPNILCKDRANIPKRQAFHAIITPPVESMAGLTESQRIRLWFR